MPLGQAYWRLLASLPPELCVLRRDTLQTLRIFVTADQREVFRRNALVVKTGRC